MSTPIDPDKFIITYNPVKQSIKEIGHKMCRHPVITGVAIVAIIAAAVTAAYFANSGFHNFVNHNWQAFAIGAGSVVALLVAGGIAYKIVKKCQRNKLKEIEPNITNLEKNSEELDKETKKTEEKIKKTTKNLEKLDKETKKAKQPKGKKIKREKTEKTENTDSKPNPTKTKPRNIRDRKAGYKYSE